MEADNAEDANTGHREAHGLVADEIYPVSEHSGHLQVKQKTTNQEQ